MSTTAPLREDQSPELSGRDLPPVLARIPWLAVQEKATPVLGESTEPTPLDPTLFQAHRVVAMPELPATDGVGESSKFRFDPPQPRLTSHEAHAKLAESSLSIAPAETTTPLQAPSPGVRTVTRPGDQGITHLRFDTMDPTTSEMVSDSTSPTLREPSAWHQMVAAVDNGFRHYHRAIALIALLTAAGLMMLVLESQTLPVEPAPEVPPPTKLDAMFSEPMPLAGTTAAPLSEAPLEPERLAMAQGPQSQQPRETTERVEPETVGMDMRPIDPVPMEPLAPYREPISTEITPMDTLPLDMPVNEQIAAGLADTPGYPSTGLPACDWPANDCQMEAHDLGRPQARLSRDLQPVSEQTK